MELPKEPSVGQEQAVAALQTIGAASGGDLVFDAGYRHMDDDGWLEVRVWLSCDQIPASGDGVPLDDWEPVLIWIPEDFPIEAPAAAAGHYGFAGEPHVLWGSQLCLYSSSAGWDPSAGMAGFLRRLVSFYECLALGTFEDPEVLWHPPIAYSVLRAGCVVITADLQPQDRTRSEAFLRWAVGVRRGPERIDIMKWLGFPGSAGDLIGALTHELREVRARIGEPAAFLVPTMVLPEPIGFEYPRMVVDLLHSLESAGVDVGLMLHQVDCTMLSNGIVSNGVGWDEHEDAFLIVRAPADKRFTTADTQAYFATWRLMPEDTAAISLEGTEAQATSRVKGWLDKGKISWATVYDTRPAAVLRRDVGRAVERVAGRRVLVLGCGALGAPIAEHCVRAGATAVYVVDSGEVHPGILVRQPYEDADVGLPKATQLTRRLSRIRPTAEVVSLPGDALSLRLLRRPCPRYYDLVIDATANRSVAMAIERSKRTGREHWPDLITVAISQTARYGTAVVAPRGSHGAGVDLLRRLALETCDEPGMEDVYEEFFPLPGKQRVFVPEPGCSDPTFVGSTTDVTALAAQLLDAALDCIPGTVRVSAAGEAAHFPRERTLCVAKLAHGNQQQLAGTRLVLPHDQVVSDQRGIYEVRIDRRAMVQMRLFVAAMAASAPQEPETGGLLLGQFDDACRVAWVTEVTGPPDGSFTCQFLLELNAPAAREHVQHRTERTRGLASFAGFWHTHPDGPVEPSAQDRETMSRLLAEDPGYAPRLMLMILAAPGGSEAADRELVAWNPDIYVEVLSR